ncbi:uncharacterized protein A1O9_09121, partial [Exophiala aquamarina CBS 119918]
MAADLPGYYFDASKNRYYKITANHVAQGSSTTRTSKYSRQAVRAEKALKQSAQREESLKASRDAVTVKRSKLLQHPLLDFEARLGNRKKCPAGVAKEFYGASLSNRPAIHPNPFTNQVGLAPFCDKFSVDEETGLLSTLLKTRGAHETGSVGLFQAASEESEFLYPQGQAVANLFDTTHVDHILSLGRASHGLNVWAYRSFSSNIRGQIQSRCSTTVIRLNILENGDLDIEGVATTYSPPAEALGLAATPSHTGFAVADEDGVTIRSLTGGGITQSLRRNPEDSKPTSVWFKDDNVLLFGARNGSLRFADVRSTTKFEESVLRMEHDSAISHIRTIGPHQVLAHGLISTSLYDLRWCAAPKTGKNPNTSSTQAYLTFNVPETRRQNRYGLGFAYDPELNIVVGASTDFHKGHRVNLWDASTGQFLQSPLFDHTFEQPVTCAQVVDLRPQAKSILLASNGAVQEW